MVEKMKGKERREKTKWNKEEKELSTISRLARFDHSYLCSGNHDS
jgi:hypothetical protein